MKSVRPPLIEVAYQQREGHKIRCGICPHECKLDEGNIGICGGRQVIGGRFIATNYAQISSLHLDPIEKKPLYHYFPGSEILSVGPNGCNLTCVWCQNWQISQNNAPTRTIMPEELADMVDALDGIGVAYTYAEPLIWFEYIRDVGRILHERGLVNVFISNGYINESPLKELLPVADAFNIDLKAADDYCYRHYCGGKLYDVQKTIRTVYEAGKHIEITHLVVTGINDKLGRIEALVNWTAALDPDIPLHLSRYFPANRYEEPPTAEGFIMQAFEVARQKLNYVYIGNLWSEEGNDTLCPKCGSVVLKRTGFRTEFIGLTGDHCSSCGFKLNMHVNGYK